jgi:hypothetical protein
VVCTGCCVSLLYAATGASMKIVGTGSRTRFQVCATESGGFGNYNAPVTVDPPPASKTIDGSKIGM